MTSRDGSVYYDPYDFEIDTDPYPVWKRLRDEQPLYYNEKYDFYALSWFDDVERCSMDWRTYSSARGSLLELIKRGDKLPPGAILFEDPPAHDVHRSLLTDTFSPRRIAALEPKIRGSRRVGGDPEAFSGLGGRLGQRRASPHFDRARVEEPARQDPTVTFRTDIDVNRCNASSELGPASEGSPA
jgi:hypothetical protein